MKNSLVLHDKIKSKSCPVLFNTYLHFINTKNFLASISDINNIYQIYPGNNNKNNISDNTNLYTQNNKIDCIKIKNNLSKSHHNLNNKISIFPVVNSNIILDNDKINDNMNISNNSDIVDSNINNNENFISKDTSLYNKPFSDNIIDNNTFNNIINNQIYKNPNKIKFTDKDDHLKNKDVHLKTKDVHLNHKNKFIENIINFDYKDHCYKFIFNNITNYIHFTELGKPITIKTIIDYNQEPYYINRNINTVTKFNIKNKINNTINNNNNNINNTSGIINTSLSLIHTNNNVIIKDNLKTSNNPSNFININNNNTSCFNFYKIDTSDPNKILHLAELDEKYNIYTFNTEIYKDQNYIPYYLLNKKDYINTYLNNGIYKNKKNYIYIDWVDYNNINDFTNDDKRLFLKIDPINYFIYSHTNNDSKNNIDIEIHLNPDYIIEYNIIKNYKFIFEKIFNLKEDKYKIYKLLNIKVNKLEFNKLNPDIDLSYYIKLYNIEKGSTYEYDNIYYLNKIKNNTNINYINPKFFKQNNIENYKELKHNDVIKKINKNKYNITTPIVEKDLLNIDLKTNPIKFNKNKNNKDRSRSNTINKNSSNVLSNKNKSNLDIKYNYIKNILNKSKIKNKYKQNKNNNTTSNKYNSLDSDSINSDIDINKEDNINSSNINKNVKSNSPNSKNYNNIDYDFIYVPLGKLFDHPYNNDSHRINCYHMYNIYVSRLLDNIIYKTGWEDVYKFKGEFRQELPCFCYGCGELVKPSGLRKHIINYHNKDLQYLESNMRINIIKKNKPYTVTNKNYYSNMNKYKTIKLTLNNKEKYNSEIIDPSKVKLIGSIAYNTVLVDDNFYFLLLFKLLNYTDDFHGFWFIVEELYWLDSKNINLFKNNFIQYCKLKTIEECLPYFDKILNTLSDQSNCYKELYKIKKIYENFKYDILLK